MLYANLSDTANGAFINRLTATAMEKEKIEVDVAKGPQLAISFSTLL